VDKRILLAVGAAAAAIVLFFVLRPDGDDEVQAPSATTTDQTTTETTETAATETTEGPPPPTELRIVYTNGRLRGGVQRFTVSRGERVVVVVVRSDVEDEVHVHGYDLMVGVAPGRRAQISFRATTVGAFEIELEDRHLQLAELEVEP
jgi:hypothetical protein